MERIFKFNTREEAIAALRKAKERKQARELQLREEYAALQEEMRTEVNYDESAFNNTHKSRITIF